ncbi:hypothetical protein JCM11641_007504 [Rhodosporidiobolus odoratus]
MGQLNSRLAKPLSEQVPMDQEELHQASPAAAFQQLFYYLHAKDRRVTPEEYFKWSEPYRMAFEGIWRFLSVLRRQMAAKGFVTLLHQIENNKIRNVAHVARYVESDASVNPMAHWIQEIYYAWPGTAERFLYQIQFERFGNAPAVRTWAVKIRRQIEDTFGEEPYGNFDAPILEVARLDKIRADVKNGVYLQPKDLPQQDYSLAHHVPHSHRHMEGTGLSRRQQSVYADWW